MDQMIDKSVIALAEALQLPERIVDAEDLPWVPFSERGNCHFKPLRFDLSTGTWTYLFKIDANQTLGRHRHTGGAVMGYNLQGRWRYEGRDWIARPGSFVFEPPGDIHTLITEGEEVLILFMIGGSLQYFDEEDRIVGQDDIFTVIKKYMDYCEQRGIAVRNDLIY